VRQPGTSTHTLRALDMASWLERTLGEIAELGFGATPSRGVPRFWAGDATGHPWATIADMRQDPVVDTAESITDAALAANRGRLVPAGTPLMSFKLTIGRVARAGRPLFTNEAIVSIRGRPTMADSDWLYHALPGIAAAGVTDNAVKGATLNKAKLLKLSVSVPPLAEQRRIAEILDTIDEAIQTSERLIAKRSQIHDGLRRELFAPLSSGPKLRLADVCDFFDDGDWIETPYITEAGIRLIQTGNIGVGEFLDKPETRRFISGGSFEQLRCKPVRAGDILICRLADPVGRACQVPASVGPAITSVDCSIVRVDLTRVAARFLLHWTQTDWWLEAAERVAGGTTRKRISRSNLGRLAVPDDSIEAQQSVSSTLDASLETLSVLHSETAKLKMLRLGLAADLLSGRVRTVSS